MKLIIDIPEEVYKALKSIVETSSFDAYSLADIIINKSKPYADILYLCDTRITDCKRISCQTDCFLTHDIKHAKNFIHIKGADCFIEYYDENRPHGKWIFEKAGNDCTDGYICSECGRSFHTKVPYFSEFNFCPNCGAQMDKGGEV